MVILETYHSLRGMNALNHLHVQKTLRVVNYQKSVETYHSFPISPPVILEGGVGGTKLGLLPENWAC